MDSTRQTAVVFVLRMYALAEAGKSCGQPVVGVVFAHIGCVHVAQHMGTVAPEKLVGTAAGHGAIVQQHNGRPSTKGILSIAAGKLGILLFFAKISSF